MFQIFETIISPLPPEAITFLLTITLAQNDGHAKNYNEFGFYQVTFANCKQLSYQVPLTKVVSDLDFNFRKGHSKALLS